VLVAFRVNFFSLKVILEGGVEMYGVVWSHRMPYLHGSFSTTEPYN